MNDLTFVDRVVALLAAEGIDTWIFGGWGEELRGLGPPRPHADLDLLHPAEDWCAVDRLDLDWIPSKRFPWKRAFVLDATIVELFLVRRDGRGLYTQLLRRRHDWPDDVLASNGRLRVASTAALASYRDRHRARRAA